MLSAFTILYEYDANAVTGSNYGPNFNWILLPIETRWGFFATKRALGVDTKSSHRDTMTGQSLRLLWLYSHYDTPNPFSTRLIILFLPSPKATPCTCTQATYKHGTPHLLSVPILRTKVSNVSFRSLWLRLLNKSNTIFFCQKGLRYCQVESMRQHSSKATLKNKTSRCSRKVPVRCVTLYCAL